MQSLDFIKKTASVRKSELVFARLFDELRHSVECGILAPGEQIPPENQLARQYKISRSSVRGALTELEERGMIEKRPGKGTFVRDTTAVSESTENKIRTIGINALQSNGIGSESWFSSKIGNSLLTICKEKKVRVSIIQPDLIDSRQLDGAILLVMPYDPEPLLKLEKEGVRTVVFNRIFTHEKIAYVSVNYRRESELAVRFLLNLGCKKIGIPSPQPQSFTSGCQRLNGACDALADSPEKGIFFEVKPLQDDQYYTEQIEQFIRNFKPDALYLENGSYAIPAMNALGNLQMSAGRDIQIICFDDIEYLQSIYRQTFYCVKMPLETMTRDAAAYLMEKINHPDQTPVLKKLYQAEIIRCGKDKKR